MADTTDVNVEEISVLDFKDEGRLLRMPAVASWSLNFGTFGLIKTLLVLPCHAWTQPMVTHPLESEGYDLTCKKALISCPKTKPRTDFMIYRGYPQVYSPRDQNVDCWVSQSLKE